MSSLVCGQFRRRLLIVLLAAILVPLGRELSQVRLPCVVRALPRRLYLQQGEIRIAQRDFVAVRALEYHSSCWASTRLHSEYR